MLVDLDGWQHVAERVLKSIENVIALHLTMHLA